MAFHFSSPNIPSLSLHHSISDRTNMLQTKPQGVPYHGWHLEVVQQDREFLFHCYPPQLSAFCNDANVYPNFQAALIAGCHFIDREIAILSLLDRVADWFEAGKIAEAEYWNLTNFN